MSGRSEREGLGRLVREAWIKWAGEQPEPKPSWLVPWDDLEAGQREVDMRIGEVVAAAERARGAEVSGDLLLQGLVAMLPPRGCSSAARERWMAALKVSLDLIYGDGGDEEPGHEARGGS